VTAFSTQPICITEPAGITRRVFRSSVVHNCSLLGSAGMFIDAAAEQLAAAFKAMNIRNDG
jgi:hypothetical protein